MKLAIFKPNSKKNLIISIKFLERQWFRNNKIYSYKNTQKHNNGQTRYEGQLIGDIKVEGSLRNFEFGYTCTVEVNYPIPSIKGVQLRTLFSNYIFKVAGLIFPSQLGKSKKKMKVEEIKEDNGYTNQ